MIKKCFRCGSDNLVKVVSAKSLVIPEIKREVESGAAPISLTRCRNCGFEWDDIMERQMLQRE